MLMRNHPEGLEIEFEKLLSQDQDNDKLQNYQ
jgi:hypothetical protein